MDTLGVGVGAAMIGLRQAALPFLIACMQVLFLCAGYRLGCRAARSRAMAAIPRKALDCLPGCTLLCLAALRLL
jgi:hypothetical protein